VEERLGKTKLKVGEKLFRKEGETTFIGLLGGKFQTRKIVGLSGLFGWGTVVAN